MTMAHTETPSAPEPPVSVPSAPTPYQEPLVDMPPYIFFLALAYLAILIAIFATYASWPAFRDNAPNSFGQIPVGVVWFGAVGAVVGSLFGIFNHNKQWKMSYNYWHYCRPLFGAVTGSIGALLYLVLLILGTTDQVKIQDVTFYAVAFVFGFADKSFIQLVQNVTAVIIKPGNQG
jgi:hypothetical protein